MLPLLLLLLFSDHIYSQVTGRSTAGQVACIVAEQPRHSSADCKVVMVTEDWLQVRPCLP